MPEYPEALEVDAIIRAAPNSRAALLFLVQWRAGLRVSEALALEARDLALDSDLPTIHVRRGKGAKPRIVPVHSGQVDTGGYGESSGGRRDSGGPASIEPYLAAFVCPAPSDERRPDQLSEPLAGTLLDTDDIHILGASAGSDEESGGGAISVMLHGSVTEVLNRSLKSEADYELGILRRNSQEYL